MANNWAEFAPDLVSHEFEIYDNVTTGMNMPTFHGHSFYEFRFISQGRVTHYSENSVCELGPGDISVMPPSVFHRVVFEPPKEGINKYSRILLYVSVPFMRYLETDQFKISEVFNAFGYPGDRHLHLEMPELDALYHPLQQIVRADRDDDPLQHLQNRAQIMLVLSRLAEYIARNGTPARTAEDSALVPRVIAYINANLDDNLSLDSLSARFFVSKFYLSHRFKEYTRLSLHQYVLIRRMMHAQKLLRAGESPTAVAAACGYREYSSFYKAFLRETGKTPRDFE